MEVEEISGVEEALSRFSGSAALLGEALDVPRKKVEYWLKTGVVAPEFCAKLERITLIPSERLNPNIDWAFYRMRNKPRTVRKPRQGSPQIAGSAP